MMSWVESGSVKALGRVSRSGWVSFMGLREEVICIFGLELRQSAVSSPVSSFGLDGHPSFYSSS